MTPKEKAEHLVSEYKKVGVVVKYSNEIYMICEIQNAKQCALIAVDNIINKPAYADSGSIYWQQVKQEIEKL